MDELALGLGFTRRLHPIERRPQAAGLRREGRDLLRAQRAVLIGLPDAVIEPVTGEQPAADHAWRYGTPPRIRLFSCP